MNSSLVRDLTPADLDWVAETTRLRRESLRPHAPRFWRPATDAVERHRAFLGELIGDPAVPAIRTDHGYLIALPRGDGWLVDDMVVAEEHWYDEGRALLDHAQEHHGRLRLVAPVAETSRATTAREIGLVPVEHWWHRDLADGSQPRPPETAQTVEVDGVVGRLVPAPPVYDPGGPVLLSFAPLDPAILTRLEAAAAAEGARVSVVSHDPADEVSAESLTAAGYLLTTSFFEPAGEA